MVPEDRRATGAETDPPSAGTARPPGDDFFARALPPAALWPDLSAAEALGYPQDLNIGALLLAAADRWPDRPALIGDGFQWTYRALFDEARRIAMVLRMQAGIGAGDRVMVRGPETPRTIAALIGVWLAGGVAVPALPAFRQRELTHMLRHAEIRVVLVDSRYADDLAEAVFSAPSVETVLHYSNRVEEPLPTIAPKGLSGLDRLLADLLELSAEEISAAIAPTRAQDPALILFTSGTTGKAKAVVHGHRSLAAIADGFGRQVIIPTDGQETFFATTPLCFAYGLGASMLYPLRFGASVVLREGALANQSTLNQPNLGHAVLKSLLDGRVTRLFTVPLHLRGLLAAVQAHPDAARRLALRSVFSAGESLPVRLQQDWQSLTGIPVYDGIGSTEMLNCYLSQGPHAQTVPGTMGVPVPGYQVMLVDGAGQRLRGAGLGRLAVRGPTGCLYLKDPERQANTIRNGWTITSDLAERRDDGSLRYIGRDDDVIIANGISVSAAEVEDVLITHPWVADCAVVGTGTADGTSQTVHAMIVLGPGVDPGPETAGELQAFLAARIAGYKVPGRYHWINSLPRTETGKLQRNRLRALLTD